jgi:hypothetical protein
VHRGGSRAVYIAYVALGLLFTIALTNRLRNSVDGLNDLLHGMEYARDPFELFETDLT